MVWKVHGRDSWISVNAGERQTQGSREEVRGGWKDNGQDQRARPVRWSCRRGVGVQEEASEKSRSRRRGSAVWPVRCHLVHERWDLSMESSDREGVWRHGLEGGRGCGHAAQEGSVDLEGSAGVQRGRFWA